MSFFTSSDSEEEGLEVIADTETPDLNEELDRQDLATLLDRAMGYLPAQMRTALELYYLAEMPQREVALRLGLSINALEVKLHRARQQLRRILSQQLRADALAFGLSVDGVEETAWRPTSLWCMFCGRHRLLGRFETDADGHNVMRLHCPNCSRREDFELVNTNGFAMLDGLYSFRPAWKRVLQAAPMRHFLSQSVRQGCQRCLFCKQIARVGAVEPRVLPSLPPASQVHYHLEVECPHCGTMLCGLLPACLAHPQAVQFFLQHPRCILSSEEPVSYQEQPALRLTLFDLASTERLFVFLHLRTLTVLGVHTS